MAQIDTALTAQESAYQAAVTAAQGLYIGQGHDKARRSPNVALHAVGGMSEAEAGRIDTADADVMSLTRPEVVFNGYTLCFAFYLMLMNGVNLFVNYHQASNELKEARQMMSDALSISDDKHQQKQLKLICSKVMELARVVRDKRHKKPRDLLNAPSRMLKTFMSCRRSCTATS